MDACMCVLTSPYGCERRGTSIQQQKSIHTHIHTYIQTYTHTQIYTQCHLCFRFHPPSNKDLFFNFFFSNEEKTFLPLTKKGRETLHPERQIATRLFYRQLDLRFRRIIHRRRGRRSQRISISFISIARIVKSTPRHLGFGERQKKLLIKIAQDAIRGDWMLKLHFTCKCHKWHFV